MTKKTIVLLSIALAAAFILPACLRQASQAPQTSQATPTGSTSPFNMARPTGLGSLQIIGTQTALALSSFPASSPNALTPLPSPTQAFFALDTQTTPVPSLTPMGTVGTPAVVILVPTAAPGRPASYSLQPGEYPYCIARRFNVNPQELLTLNNLPENPPLLQAGTVLQIPQTGNPFPGSRALHTHPATFTVSDPNETIYGVACYFGDLDPTAIAAANSLVPPYTLRVGQSLNIP